MGWLFAVALGMQERSHRVTLIALLPIAAGHALSVVCFFILATLLRWSLPMTFLRFLIAFVLLAFGTYRLLRQRHLRWVGMRVSWWELDINLNEVADKLAGIFSPFAVRRN